MTAQTAEKISMAQDYANDIAKGLEMLEELTANSDWADVSPESVKYARDYYELEPQEDTSPREAAEQWISHALDIKQTRDMATNEIVGYEFGVTFGGPNCWVEFDGNSYATIKVFWGSDRGERRVKAEELNLYIFNALDE